MIVLGSFVSLDRDCLSYLFSFLSRREWFSILLTCKIFYQIILQRIDFSCDDQFPLGYACTNGRVGMLNFLLRQPRVDPTKASNLLQLASWYGHAEIVKVIKRVLS